MKVALTSDWHGCLPEIPPCDVLVLAGDYEPNTNPLQSIMFYRAMAAHIRAAPIRLGTVMIAGNHDWQLYRNPSDVLTAMGLGRRFHYLQDSGCEIDGARFWGTPWTPPFFNWAFMKPEDELRDLYARIPTGTDVLVAHGPPRGVLDQNSGIDRCGSIELMAALKRAKPRVCVFGHIHEQGGKGAFVRVGNGLAEVVECYNVSHVDPSYQPRHQVRVVEFRGKVKEEV